MNWPELVNYILTFMAGLAAPFIWNRLFRKQELRRIDKTRIGTVREAAYSLWEMASEPVERGWPHLPRDLSREATAAVIELHDRRLSRYWSSFSPGAIIFRRKRTRDYLQSQKRSIMDDLYLFWAERIFRKLVRRLNHLERTR